MLARTSAVVEPGGVLGALSCQPPLTLRKVHGDCPGTCELALVATAAGPLAGDDLELSLQVREGARAALRATGASIAQGRGGPGGRLRICADVGDGACLTAEPGALVACAGSRTDVAVRLGLAATAAVDWRDLVVLGRAGERAGAATLRFDVTCDGRPLLRQFLDLSDPDLVAWPGHVARQRVLAAALLAAPGARYQTVVHSPAAVAQPLPGGAAVLVTVLAADAAGATAVRDELCARSRAASRA